MIEQCYAIEAARVRSRGPMRGLMSYGRGFVMFWKDVSEFYVPDAWPSDFPFHAFQSGILD